MEPETETHNPIVRVTTADGKYVQFSVNPDGEAVETDQIIEDIAPDSPAINIAAVFGEWDVKIVWIEGDDSPTFTANKMEPNTGLGGGGSPDPGSGVVPIGGLGDK